MDQPTYPQCTAVEAPWLHLKFLPLLFNALLLHRDPCIRPPVETATPLSPLNSQTLSQFNYYTLTHRPAHTLTHTVQSCK